MPTLEEILTEVVRLANEAGLGPFYVVGLLLAAALLLMMGRIVKRLPPPPPEVPAPPATWNQDPAQGAVVVPGPPGGTDDQVQGG